LNGSFPVFNLGWTIGGKTAAKNPFLPDNDNVSAQKTLHEIDDAIGALSLPERLRLYIHGCMRFDSSHPKPTHDEL
jgi:hypothetical protein